MVQKSWLSRLFNDKDIPDQQGIVLTDGFI